MTQVDKDDSASMIDPVDVMSKSKSHAMKPLATAEISLSAKLLTNDIASTIFDSSLDSPYERKYNYQLC